MCFLFSFSVSILFAFLKREKGGQGAGREDEEDLGGVEREEKLD